MVSYLPKIVILLVITLLAACEQESRTTTSKNQLAPITDIGQTIAELTKIARRQDRVNINLMSKLKAATSLFLREPNTINKQSLQYVWQQSHEAYLVNQMGLFIDPQTKYILGFNIDAWPIQPGFLDAIEGYPDSGIINDVTLEISTATLRSQHGITASEEVCLGFHAIEYLIFARATEEFVLDADPTHKASILRRRKMLQLVVEELEFDMLTLSRLINNQFEPDNKLPAIEQLSRWIMSARQHLQLAFRESNFLLDSSLGHNAFSDTSRESLLVVLNFLANTTWNQTSLITIFSRLDANSAKNYEITLNQAIQSLATEQTDDTALTKFPLMLSALLHQLEAFEVKLNQAIRAAKP